MFTQNSSEEHGKTIVLDAKYRIEEGLMDALNSVHTYRDALIRETSSGAKENHRISCLLTHSTHS